MEEMTYKLLTNIPKLPENLILSVEEVLELENHAVWEGATKNYTLHRCQDELREYLEELFPERKDFWYQTIVQELPMHKNKNFSEFYNRELPGTRINYLIDAGGENVQTIWYKEVSKENEVYISPTHNVVFPIHTWHELKVFIYHSVVNIEKGRRRFAITAV